MIARGPPAGLVKIHLVVAQLLPFAMLVEVSLFGTFYAVAPALLAVAGLLAYRCGTCGTPIWDERIIGRRVPVSPSVIDHCGVCGQPMFERRGDDSTRADAGS